MSTCDIHRTADGRFYYDRKHASNRRVDATTRQRLRKLAIPPAYGDVCATSNPSAPLQATAVDARGQTHRYYHPDALARRRSERLDRASSIDRRRILAETERRLRLDPSDADATILRMMTIFHLRSGGRSDAKSFGAFTLRRREHVHLHADGETIRLQFVGKSGVLRDVSAKDAILHRTLSRSTDDVLAMRTTKTRVRDLLRRTIGSDTAKLKDLRTHAAMSLFDHFSATMSDTEALRATARELGHNPGTCKKYYALRLDTGQK